MVHKNSRIEKKKKRQNKTQNDKSKKKKSLFFKILFTLILLTFAVTVTGGSLFAYYASQAPELNKEDLIDPIASEVLDKDGEVITRLGTENRELIDYEEIPSIVEKAVLSTEDVRFYDHYGVDPIRLGKAVFANFTDGFGSEGASTITQQVIKQSFLTPEKSLERKAQEAWLAFKFEQEYSKSEILEMYLNKTYYSDSIYGIETAANYYFNKSIDELSLSEAALLAGIPQSPNNYNPYDYPEKAKERRNTVLYLMNYHDQITVEEMEEAQQVAIMEDVVERNQEDRAQLTTNQGYKAFIDYVIEQLGEKGDYNIYEDGLRIHTTLDPDAQSHLEEILNTEDIIDFPANKNNQPFQAGVTLLDTKSGAIRAIGGGRNYGAEVKRGFNFATDINRQSGSVIKPLLDYAPAIENKQWSTAHIIEDEEFEYQDGGKPKNWDGAFKGAISIREALWDSRNIPAIKVFNEVGHENAVEFVNRLGLNYDDNEVYESAAIGGDSTGTNPMEMAGAYAAFGNAGIYNEPYAITKVERRDGSIEEFSYETNAAMKASTAYMITDMLKEVVENPQGTGTAAAVPGLEIAGKTGTTNYTDAFKQANNIDSGGAPDSWFAGYTTQYTAAIWTGYKDRSNPLTQTERKTAQKLFNNLMREVSGEDTPNFERPDDVIEIEVEKGSNPVKRASKFTPDDQVVRELFLKGYEPSAVSDQFIPNLSPPSNTENEEDNGDSTDSDTNSDEEEQTEETESSSETEEEESSGTDDAANDTNEEEKSTEETEDSSETEAEESVDTDDAANDTNEEEQSTEETEDSGETEEEESTDTDDATNDTDENEDSSESTEEETADTIDSTDEGDQ
ncbi:transglycosylase domain-containing protein [Paraliobacillus sediminis]|uniref:transglycosylase domain-containing protein n=1 Tax=Paraliobacillus sediminis TaxID=1885916 RepID=UPI000E3D125D|nr:PBP1A family penicillin-binding protein [Paraliobacillus sediminis]